MFAAFIIIVSSLLDLQKLLNCNIEMVNTKECDIEQMK